MRISALVFACLAVAGVLASIARASAPGEQTLSPALQSAIVAAANRELAKYGGKQPVPGVYIGVWAPGVGTFVKGIGYSNLKTRAPFQPSDRFRIGSNTKTFVVSVLLQLVDEHRLSLDDPLSTFHLGIKMPNAQNITVRELCEMRSGILDAYNTPQADNMKFEPNTPVNPKQLVAWAFENKPLFPPGSKYNYSNINYLLLGMIIESLTHDSVANEIQKRLVKPFGLSQTTFPIDDPNMPKPYARGYGFDKDKNWIDVSAELPPTLSGAAGAMVSTLPDMRRWVKLYVSGRTNGAATQRERLHCIPIGKGGLSFGLGIGCSGGWYGYTGGIPGYNTGAYYLPAKDATIIAFVTSQREHPDPGVANSIVRDITRILFPKNVVFP